MRNRGLNRYEGGAVADFNRRCAPIEERIFDSVDRHKPFLNFVFARAAERTGNAGKFRCQSVN